jgi:hypothetical protein
MKRRELAEERKIMANPNNDVENVTAKPINWDLSGTVT